MHTFKIAVINPILNFRQFVSVKAESYYAALNSTAIYALRRIGYTTIESCREI